MKQNFLTRKEAGTLINETLTEYKGLLGTLHEKSLHTDNDLSEKAQQLADSYNMFTEAFDSPEYITGIKDMDSAGFEEFLTVCRTLSAGMHMSISAAYPAGIIKVSEITREVPENIQPILNYLNEMNDTSVTNAVKEYYDGNRNIIFTNLGKNTNGKTVLDGNIPTNMLSDRFSSASTPEQIQQAAVILMHEFCRKNTNGSTVTETQNIILNDIRNSEKLYAHYGSSVYQNNPELGILHCMKNLYGETDVKEFARLAFDSSGSYWKVAEHQIVDDNTNVVVDKNGVQYAAGHDKQDALEQWLGIGNAYAPLMRPSGYRRRFTTTSTGTTKRWTTSPAGITELAIGEAFKNEQLTKKQYEYIKAVMQLDECRDLVELAEYYARLQEQNPGSPFLKNAKSYLKGKNINVPDLYRPYSETTFTEKALTLAQAALAGYILRKKSLPAVIVLAGLTAGRKMLPNHMDDFAWFDNGQPQKIGGYHNLYENFTHNDLVCNIDSLRTDFKNTQGHITSVWLWKGSYNLTFNGGWNTGAEIGAYTDNRADDSIIEKAGFKLNAHDTELIDRYVEGQYWINGFVPQEKISDQPENLEMVAEITFYHEKDAQNYETVLNQGLSKKDISTGKSKNLYFYSINTNSKIPRNSIKFTPSKDINGNIKKSYRTGKTIYITLK